MNRLPDLEVLRALVQVAEAGSINAAASHLGVSQQAVSLRIRGLEAQLGIPLLIRSPRGSTLTAAGELVAGWAEALLGAAEEFGDAVESLRTRRSKRLRLAASLTIAEHLLPEWIARWRGARTDCPEVQLVAANSSAVADAVRRADADLGFIETPEVPGDLGSAQIGWDEIVVVAPPVHPWSRRPVTAQELARTPLVLREPGSGTRESLENSLRHAGFAITAPPAAVLSTTLGIRSTIAAGTAPGALSSLAVQDDIRTQRVRRVELVDLRIVRPLTVIWLGSRPPQSTRDLLEAMRQLVRKRGLRAAPNRLERVDTVNG